MLKIVDGTWKLLFNAFLLQRMTQLTIYQSSANANELDKLPCKLLPSRYNSTSSVKFPIFCGIHPLILLKENDSLLNTMQSPELEGSWQEISLKRYEMIQVP